MSKGAMPKSSLCSPTAIALGSSAIVKVAGQNCFWTLYSSLGQIRLGPPKSSAESSTKVPPREKRFHQGSSSFVVSLVLLGRSVLGWKKGPVLKVLWKVHHGSTKVSPRFHQGLTKVAQVSWSLWSCGAEPFWGAKRFCGRFPHHFFKLVSQFRNSFLHFAPTALALGSSAIVKVLGHNDTFVFWGSLQQMAFASQKVLWSVPQTVLYIGLTVSCGFLGKWLLLQKRFCGGFRQLYFTFISQSPPGVEVAWVVDMSHPYKSSPQKTVHHVVAVGVFFGLIFVMVPSCWWANVEIFINFPWDLRISTYQTKGLME